MARTLAASPAELSIVIPTLNEAASLPLLLADLAEQRDIKLQVIVADGGSTDATCELAVELGALVENAAAGRAKQLNAGASRASAAWLLFLHADSRLGHAKGLRQALDHMLGSAAVPPHAGHFVLEFSDCESGQYGYRLLQTKTALNRLNTTNGDQGMLLSAADFRAQGGFDESLPFLEDQRFAEKLRADGQWSTLPVVLQTSARRFETEGFKRRYTLMSLIMGMHASGMQRFFDNAPALYRAQHETAQLALAPFIALAWRVFWPAGWRNKIRLGQFVSSNAWQFFLMWDVWRDPALGDWQKVSAEQQPRTPALRFYDRWLVWFFDSAVAGALTLPLLCIWFFGVLWPWYHWVADPK